MAKASVSGFIVRNNQGRYLSRRQKWVRHRLEEQGYVHSPEQLAMGGAWVTQASTFTPARYNSNIEYPEIQGDPIPFEEYVASIQPTSTSV